MSFDGITDDMFFGVDLTSIKQNMSQLASKAVEVLMRRINGEKVESKYVVDTTFVKGETA